MLEARTADQPLQRTVRVGRPLDLMLTLSPLQRGGRADPTMRFTPDGVWRASRTPEGPATTRYSLRGDLVVVEAWGRGAAWALDQAPAVLGILDDDSEFLPRHPLLARLQRRFAGLRLTRTDAVFESLVPVVLEQKVVTLEARRSYLRLVRSWGEPAPGPAGLMLQPAPAALAAQPYWAYHPFGIERKRAETLRRAAVRARRLEEAASMEPAAAYQRLQAIPGIGPWTAAMVGMVSLGDPDAVPVGDYNLPHLVGWALEGRARSDDERMLRLLEPYRGHRARVLRLLLVSGLGPPRFGPRLPLRRIEDL
jgi:3-methyladenine DNA glycosylase/8-oxoguanine DNA glycosylase